MWLDLKDAFGSVPHPVLLKVLSLTGLQGATNAIITDIYMGSTTSIQTKSERFPQIPCLRGVKQGCPISPILFNLAMEVVIQAMEEVPESGYQIANSTIKTCTYATYTYIENGSPHPPPPPPPRKCKIPEEQVEAHFTTVYARSPPLGPSPGWLFLQAESGKGNGGSVPEGDNMHSPFSPKGVVKQFQRTKKSAPGLMASPTLSEDGRTQKV